MAEAPGARNGEYVDDDFWWDVLKGVTLAGGAALATPAIVAALPAGIKSLVAQIGLGPEQLKVAGAAAGGSGIGTLQSLESHEEASEQAQKELTAAAKALDGRTPDVGDYSGTYQGRTYRVVPDDPNVARYLEASRRAARLKQEGPRRSPAVTGALSGAGTYVGALALGGTPLAAALLGGGAAALNNLVSNAQARAQSAGEEPGVIDQTLLAIGEAGETVGRNVEQYLDYGARRREQASQAADEFWGGVGETIQEQQERRQARVDKGWENIRDWVKERGEDWGREREKNLDAVMKGLRATGRNIAESSKAQRKQWSEGNESIKEAVKTVGGGIASGAQALGENVAESSDYQREKWRRENEALASGLRATGRGIVGLGSGAYEAGKTGVQAIGQAGEAVGGKGGKYGAYTGLATGLAAGLNPISSIIMGTMLGAGIGKAAKDNAGGDDRDGRDTTVSRRRGPSAAIGRNDPRYTRWGGGLRGLPSYIPSNQEGYLAYS